ncbi:MAG: peptidylprolyl isomerase [Gammaproteobacteria bacterium]|nr:peptidylprolyl isomerase [Gammaproteobacteria bacterium]
MDKITANRVVTIQYALYDEAGELVEDTSESGPFSYVHGAEGILPGLELALEGMSKGDTAQVTISPSDGYGEIDPDAFIEVPLSEFPEGTQLTVGMEVTGQSIAGPSVFRVLEVGEETVKVDSNHPMAGKTLEFYVEVLEVREASQEELEQGLQAPPTMH